MRSTTAADNCLSLTQLPQKLGAFISSVDLTPAESPNPTIAKSCLEVAFIGYKALWAFLMPAVPASGLRDEDLHISPSLQPQATPRSALARSIGKQLQASGIAQHVIDAAASVCKLLHAASRAAAPGPGPSLQLLMLSEQLMQTDSLIWMLGRPPGPAEGRLLQAMFNLPLAVLQATSTYVESLPASYIPEGSEAVQESMTYEKTAATAVLSLLYVPGHPLLQHSLVTEVGGGLVGLNGKITARSCIDRAYLQSGRITQETWARVRNSPCRNKSGRVRNKSVQFHSRSELAA